MRTILFILLMSFMGIFCTHPGKAVGVSSSIPPDEKVGIPPDQAQQAKAFSITTEAFYQAILKPVASSDQRISLRLTPTHEAIMTIDYFSLEPVIPTQVDTGGWSTLDNGNLMLHLKHEAEPVDSLVLEFRPDGEKLIYIGDKYGLVRLVMWVPPVPVPST